MNNFFKAFLSFGLATSIQKLLGFIILPVYTRYFDSTEYGVIDMVGTILSIAVVFGLLQLETSMQRYYYEYSGLKRKILISTIYFWIICLSLLVGLLMFLFSEMLSDILFKNKSYTNLIQISSVQVPLTNVSMLGLVLLRYRRENYKFLIVIVVKVLASLGFIFLLVVYFEAGLYGVFLAQLLSLLLSTLLVTFYVRDEFVLKVSNLISRVNFMYALPQFPARVGSILLAQANRFFMLSFLSLSAIGIYSVSLKIASAIQLVNTAFIMAWTPFMHKQFKQENNKQVFAEIFPLVSGIIFLCVCIVSLYSNELINLLATEEYIEGAQYIGGLAMFFGLYIIKETVDIGPKIRERTKYLSLTFFISLIVNLLSLYVLIEMFELKGVVIAMVLTNLVLVFISWYVSNSMYFISFSKGKFLIYLLPTLVVIGLVMYYNFDLKWRIVMSGLSLLYFCPLMYSQYLNMRKEIK